MIKVLIADDHPIVLEGLKQILSECDDIVVEDVATTGNEVIEKVENRDYHVVILDISMPGRDGVDTLKELKKHLMCDSPTRSNHCHLLERQFPHSRDNRYHRQKQEQPLLSALQDHQ